MNRGLRLRVLSALVGLVCAACLSLHARAQAASGSVNRSAPREFLAHGTGDRFWLARVTMPGGAGASHPTTTLYSRAAGEGSWQELRRLEARAAALAHRGTQLALLLDGGTWVLVSQEAVATGRPVPTGTPGDLATRGETLLALSSTPLPAAPAQVPEPHSRPAGAAAASPSPAGTPAPRNRLLLYALDAGRWSEAAPPLDVPAAGAAPSLAVVDHVPYVAFAASERTVEVHRHAPGEGWVRHAVLELEHDLREFDLLGGGAVPVLLTQGWEAVGQTGLHWLRGTPGAVQTVPVAAPPGARAYPAAAAVAVGKVRVLFAGAGEMELLETSYDLLGPAGDAGAAGGTAQVATVALPAPALNPAVMVWARSFITLVLLFTVIASLRRRREMQEMMPTAHRLPLAPPGRRLLAGLIDALPVLAGAAVFAFGAWSRNEAVERVGQAITLAGAGLYLLHTTVAEAVAGRTVGKWCCGLRVVGLDGGRASAGALVARNLLRVIDLSMAFFPLVLVLYSPLRQRAGDVAAGTLVVSNEPVVELEEAGTDTTGQR